MKFLTTSIQNANLARAEGLQSRSFAPQTIPLPKWRIIRHISPVQSDPSVVPGGALLSRGVSIKGSVKFLNELLLEGEVEGTIVSTGTLTIGEQAHVRGEIRTKSVNVRGTVEGNIFVTQRCELQANCTVRGDIEAPRLVVSENATFLGSAKVGAGKSLPA